MVNVKGLSPATKLGLQLLAQKMAMRRTQRELMQGKPAPVGDPNQPQPQPGQPVPAMRGGQTVDPNLVRAVMAVMASRGRVPGMEGGPEPSLPGQPPTGPQPSRPGLPGSKVPADAGVGGNSDNYFWSDPAWKNPFPQVGNNEA